MSNEGSTDQIILFHSLGTEGRERTHQDEKQRMNTSVPLVSTGTL